MNKTIIININGIVFHIEEDAYEVLKSYMTEVKRHFAYSADSVEIVTDIENRLAEMFTQRLAEHNKQVIVLQDVEEITLQMGRASDFEDDEESEGFTAERLKSSKTLYRDGEDKMIAGVCAGLGHYFDIETKWVRLITIIATLTSGIGLLPYIVLWIVLPIAKTRQEKMAMKGEAINLENFKKSFDETAVTGKSVSGQALRSVNYSDPVKEIIDFTVKLLKIFLKVIGLIIITAGAIALFAAIFALIFGLGFLDNGGDLNFPFNIINEEYRSPIFFSAFLVLCIPLIALILFAIRVLLNRKVVSRYSSFAMLVLWLTGLGMGIYYGSKVASDFREEARVEQSSALTYYPSITLKMNSKLFFTSSDSLKYNIGRGKFSGRVFYGDNMMDHEMQDIDIFIEKSDDTTFTVIKELSGRGQNFEHALQAAQRINYRVTQKDSIINFDKYLSLAGSGNYRKQEVDVHLKIPVNTKVKIEGNLEWKVRDINLWDCQDENNHSDTNISEWLMTEEGLTCISKEKPGTKENTP
jgi:phage shock protein PspC (stress-responsive transcriptional regulator)